MKRDDAGRPAGFGAGHRRSRCRVRPPAWRVAVILLLAGVSAGCDRPESGTPGAPSASEIAAYYRAAGDFTVEMSGNVAQVTAVIDQDAYRMGGELWARAAPYIFLFSSATQAAMTENPGLGGVRMIVRYQDGSIVAQALLDRSSMRPAQWGQALAVAGRARSEGSDRPGFMRDLVRWGEDHTTFDYNPDYIRFP